MTSSGCGVHRLRGTTLTAGFMKKLHHLEMALARSTVHGSGRGLQPGLVHREPAHHMEVSIRRSGVDCL